MIATETNLETTICHIDVARFNGRFTLRNSATGQHRTFRIHTVKSGDLKDRRILSLLCGPDNERDFIGLAFVDHHSVRPFRKCGNGERALCRFVEFCSTHPSRVPANVSIQFEVTCRRCGRALTTPESIRDGIGPVCRSRSN